MKIVSWNIAGSREPWRRLLDVDADIALLQEAGKPPEVAACIDVNPGPWRTAPQDGTCLGGRRSSDSRNASRWSGSRPRPSRTRRRGS